MSADFTNPLKRPPLLALGVFIGCMLGSSLLIWKMEQNKCRAYKADIQNLAQNHTFLIRDNIDQALALNYSLASLLRIEQGSMENFESFASEVLPSYPSISHLSLSPEGIIEKVYPLAGNESSIGFNQLQSIQQNKEARLALRSGELTLAGPLNLVQGGLGIVGRLPVFIDTKDATKTDQAHATFWGFTNVTLKMEPLLKQANLDKLNDLNMAYKLWRINPSTEKEQLIVGYKLEHLVNPIDKHFAVPNGEWVLSVSPIGGWYSAWAIGIKVFLALLISTLLGYQTSFMVYLQKRKLLLEAAITNRTSEVNEARMQLEATLDAIPDLLFEVTLSGLILTYHTKRQELLRLKPNEFLGRKFCEVLPKDTSDMIAAALEEANEKGLSAGKTYSLDFPRGTKWFELSVARKAIKANEETQFVMIVRDITDRRHAEDELRIAATAFEAREGMMITAPDARILRVNKAFTEITGYNAAEVIGRTPRILRSNRHEGSFYEAMWQAIKQRSSWQGELWNRRPNGDVYPVWLTITAVFDEDAQVTHYVSTLTDITERKASEARINNLAFYDSLTQLPNRRLLQDRLEHAVIASHRQGHMGALLFIDLDDFKTLNDNRGHHLGDLLLIAVADRLRQITRNDDSVGRLGGDEFLIVLEGLSKQRDESLNQVHSVAEKILESLNKAYWLDEAEYFTSASIGIALFGNDHLSPDELLKQADQAMYHAKAAGRNTYRFFDPEMQALSAERFNLQNEIRDALQLNQFQMHYQPQVNAANQLIGAESLIRWYHPHRGLVSPMEFIPLAEESGLILPLGQWILAEACKQLNYWAQSAELARLTLSVNISARQFQHPQFVSNLLSLIETSGINPEKLKLELTESMLLTNHNDIIVKMDALKSCGIKLSLDDFGTGYSSLAYLKRLPISELKIDKSFVDDVLTDPNDAAIALTVIRLAQSMELSVIAEGVETKAQRDWLEQQGCYSYQGYYFGKPVSAEEFDKLIASFSTP